MARSACITCHQRKVRCDAHIRGFPCSKCVSSGNSDCRIHQKKRRAVPRPGNNLVPICSRSSAEKPSNWTSRSLQPLQHDENSLNSPKFQSFDEEDQDKVGSGPDNLKDHTGVDLRAIHKGVRITFVGKDVSNISFLVRQRLEGQNERVYHFPSGEIAKKYMRHESDRVPQEALMLPDKVLADELIAAYFTHVNPGCPILNEEIFMAQYAGFNPADPPSLLVLQAVLLVGAHVSKVERSERDALKAMLFRRAKMLFEARVEWNRDHMVQAALLLSWHSDGVEDVAANAWHWVGTAARIATGLGMHRDTSSSSLSPSDKCRWRRTWWMLFQYDVTVSLFYGRPQAINLDECDVTPLSAVDCDGCGTEAQIEYVLNYTELCILISGVLRKKFALRTTPEQRKTALTDADEALANWCLRLPPSLHLRSSGTSLWTSILHLTYSNFLILLHRPNPRASHRLDDSGPNDADICVAAANTITTIFEDLRKTSQIRYISLAGLNAIFTGMIQVSVELRFSNPVLAIHARRRFESTLYSVRELAEYWIIGESILRLFQGTSTVQNGPELRGDLRDDGRSQSGACDQKLQNDSLTPRKALQRPQAQINVRARARSDLDVLAAAANAAVQSINAGLIEQEQEEVCDWRQLFPFTTSNQEDFRLAEDITLMENEWRDLYWQEPNMLGTFWEVFEGWP